MPLLLVMGSPVKPGMTGKGPGMTVEMADQVGHDEEAGGHDGGRL
mgnify:CR=1 FL=1